MNTPTSTPEESGEDEEIAERMKKGDQRALERLLEKHSGLLLAVIGRCLHDPEECHDVFVEIQAEIWENIGKYEQSKGRFLGWLITLARRRALDRIRRMQAYYRMRDSVGLEAQKIDREPATWEHEPENDVFERLHEWIHSAFIPDEQRDCLILHYFEGMTQRDIVKHTGIALGTVKTRLELGFRVLSSLVASDPTFSKR